jgi:hypothetical protein
MHHAEPSLLADALLFQDPSGRTLPTAITSRNFPPLDQMSETQKQQLFNLWHVVRSCLDQHKRDGLNWPPPPEVIERFKRWSEGIVT